MALASTLLLPSTLAGDAPAPKDGGSPKPFDCGTDTAHASDDFLNAIKTMHSAKHRRDASSPAARANDPIVIDTVFHIIATEATKADITNEMPSAQLDSLNESYAPYHISFNLLNVTWTTNDAWALGEADADKEMKKALRQGSYATLNIYFQTQLLSGAVLGKCTLPSSVGPAGDTVPAAMYFSDGCNVNANTMPGGVMDGYNKGKTAVHETGHWLGLLHTFEGKSCEGEGDFIDDTPPEKESTDGCPVGKSTCPGTEDPIHNFMDYSEDACYEGFTEGQVERVMRMWGEFREGR